MVLKEQCEERIHPLEVIGRSDVAVSDCGDCDRQEVSRVEQRPSFELVIDDATYRVVSDQDESVRLEPLVRATEAVREDAQADGHQGYLRVQVVRGVKRQHGRAKAARARKRGPMSDTSVTVGV